jgi:hypothetical protein
MKFKCFISAVILTAIIGCGHRQAGVSEAEKKTGDTGKQLQEAREQLSPEQKVADLEKQLAEAKKELGEAKGATPAPAEPPPPTTYVIPVGTAIPVRTTTALSTKTTSTGTPFAGSLTKPLTVDGVMLAPVGAEVSGVVVRSDPGGRVKGKASISVTLKSIQGTYGPIAIETNSKEAIARSAVKKDVIRGGIMTGLGAAIGAIAGGGKGAAIGAGIGAGAGVGTAMATRGTPAEFPAETALTFKTNAASTVTVQP